MCHLLGAQTPLSRRVKSKQIHMLLCHQSSEATISGPGPGPFRVEEITIITEPRPDDLSVPCPAQTAELCVHCAVVNVLALSSHQVTVTEIEMAGLSRVGSDHDL